VYTLFFGTAILTITSIYLTKYIISFLNSLPSLFSLDGAFMWIILGLTIIATIITITSSFAGNNKIARNLYFSINFAWGFLFGLLYQEFKNIDGNNNYQNLFLSALIGSVLCTGAFVLFGRKLTAQGKKVDKKAWFVILNMLIIVGTIEFFLILVFGNNWITLAVTIPELCLLSIFIILQGMQLDSLLENDLWMAAVVNIFINFLNIFVRLLRLIIMIAASAK